MIIINYGYRAVLGLGHIRSLWTEANKPARTLANSVPYRGHALMWINRRRWLIR